MERLILYLDLPILGGIVSWIQDTALLWMVGQVTSDKPGLKKCIFGGLIGGVFQFLFFINQASSGQLFRWIWSPLLFMLIIPGTMIAVVFFPLNFRRGVRAGGYFYLLSFLLAGIHWGIDSLNQYFFQTELSWWWRFWLHIALIFILGELGWGIVHRKVWEQVCLYPIKICWDGHEVELTAFLDTGNTLTDPLTKIPVVIVEMDYLRQFLPLELIEISRNLHQGELNIEWKMPENWEERFRLLPFHSVGKSGGMMAGFRPDHLTVFQKEQAVVHRNIIVGLHLSQLSPDGVYHGLIPPVVLS